MTQPTLDELLAEINEEQLIDPAEFRRRVAAMAGGLFRNETIATSMITISRREQALR